MRRRNGQPLAVKHWFDKSGAPQLGDLDHHYPYNDPRARGHLHGIPHGAAGARHVGLQLAKVTVRFRASEHRRP